MTELPRSPGAEHPTPRGRRAPARSSRDDSAHGVGSRTDLPIPLGLALYGAGAAILISFVVLLLFWRTPKLGGAESGRPLPAAVQRVVDSPGARTALQVLSLATAALVTVVAFAGPGETSRNLAPGCCT
ncbi:hypothetical protein [Blastococcus brunescens]|uniref:Uncharacterized protein n=1 Tax=Blastococcus brunescens TaxID=1564165 RepID=A0ABZ1B2V6_9ACTN|nr:hypothetical protein [Blastococcus sp. BMG 8361]WRL65135.1 hypothetical protein U6N30_05485 [Blastococcus sp. BMG 8361]